MAKKDTFYMNLKTFQEDSVVAICDADLMGGTYREGPLKLEISEKFYGKNKVYLKECIEVLKNTGNANLVGKKIVKTAIELGLVHEESVLYVDNIPHAIIIF